MPSKNPQSRKHQPVPCRAVVLVQSRNKGVPISAALTPAHTGILPMEEAVLALGLFGVNDQGRPFARAGIYGIESDAVPFKCAINFDTCDGSPIYRPERGVRRTISESDMAAINWLQASLFDTKELVDGDYFLRFDRSNAGGPPDLDEARDIEIQIKRMPQRAHFAAERRVESSIEMFANYLERRASSAAKARITPPKRIPVINVEQVPPHFLNEGVPLLPFEANGLPAKSFVSFAVNRFSSALRVQTGRYRDVKGAFIRAFNTIDSFRKTGRRGPLLNSLMERTLVSVQQSAEAHIRTLDPQFFDLETQMESLQHSLDALRAYYTNRNSDDTVQVYSISSLAGQDESVVAKTMSLFQNPMFTGISGVPVQIFSNYMSTGEFPADGREIFRTAA